MDHHPFTIQAVRDLDDIISELGIPDHLIDHVMLSRPGMYSKEHGNVWIAITADDATDGEACTWWKGHKATSRVDGGRWEDCKLTYLTTWNGLAVRVTTECKPDSRLAGLLGFPRWVKMMEPVVERDVNDSELRQDDGSEVRRND